MMNIQVILNALTNMIAHCKELNSLLLQDQQLFKQNNIAEILKSDKLKQAAIEAFQLEVKTVCDLLNQENPGQTHFSWDDLLKRLSPQDHTQAASSIKELSTLAKECNAIIKINTQVVSHNMSQLQWLWESLVSCKPKENDVYSQHGTLL